MSDLEADENSIVKESCESGNSESCELCKYDNCNGDHHYCVSCNSDADPDCAGRKGSVPEALLVDCDESKCVSKFEGNVFLVNIEADVNIFFHRRKQHCD